MFASDFYNNLYGFTPLVKKQDAFGNCDIAPDPRTIRKLGWLDKTVGILGNVVESNSEIYDEVAPRSLMNKALQNVEVSGFYTIKVATELEHYRYLLVSREVALNCYRGIKPDG